MHICGEWILFIKKICMYIAAKYQYTNTGKYYSPRDGNSKVNCIV